MYTLIRFSRSTAVLLLSLFVLTGCTSLYFHPTQEYVLSPADINIEYETIKLTTEDDIVLNNWLLKADKPKGIIYYLHGNGENISTHIASVHWLVKEGYSVFLLDYRGYGKSTGNPKLPDVFLDIEAGFEWIQHTYPELPLYMLGQSLGGSLTTCFVSELDGENAMAIHGVFIDGTFSNYQDIAQDLLNTSWLTYFFQYPIAKMMYNDHHPMDCVAHIKAPLYIYHSPQDRMIHWSHAEILQMHAPEGTQLIWTAGPHNQTFLYPQFQQMLVSQLNKHNTP